MGSSGVVLRRIRTEIIQEMKLMNFEKILENKYNEAFSGQVYPAIFIAQLMGLHLGKKLREVE